MNDKKLEALLLAARPYSAGQFSAFTHIVMQRIKPRATLSRNVRTTSKQPKWSLLMKLRTLHGVSLGLAIAIAITLLAGAAYASVRYVPDLIEILSKKINGQGRLEYVVPSFADCDTQAAYKLDTFEVKPTAGLSDEDVKKTLQAKCELLGITKFASDTWPTYGQHKNWHSGDDIFYTRPELLGTVQNIDKHSVTIVAGGTTKTYATFQNKDLLAYTRDEQTKLSTIKPGDLVFTIERVAEKYYSGPHTGQQSNPRPLGIVAIVKLTLPERYYFDMQQYIREVQPCANNPGERCSNGPDGAGIDIFPREGGEGARNPDFRQATSTTIWRNINGVVISIEADKFTIRSSSGATYAIRLSKSLIDDYNTRYAPLYEAEGTHPTASQITMHPGSWVNVYYLQEPSESAKDVAKADIMKVMLLTDVSPKAK